MQSKQEADGVFSCITYLTGDCTIKQYNNIERVRFISSTSRRILDLKPASFRMGVCKGMMMLKAVCLFA